MILHELVVQIPSGNFGGRCVSAISKTIQLTHIKICIPKTLTILIFPKKIVKPRDTKQILDDVK